MTLLVSATGITGVLTSESDSPAPYQSPPQGILDIHFLHPPSTCVQNTKGKQGGKHAVTTEDNLHYIHINSMLGVAVR